MVDDPRMGIPITPYEITLNRFKDKLLAQLHRLKGDEIE
jgi:hypothetical protein